MAVKKWCPHFKEVMVLNDCFFCFFKHKEELRNERNSTIETNYSSPKTLGEKTP